MKNGWEELLHEIKAVSTKAVSIWYGRWPVLEDKTLTRKMSDKILPYFNQQSPEKVGACIDDLLQLCKEEPTNPCNPLVPLGIVVILLYKLTPDRRFVLVKKSIQRLAEELDSSKIVLNENGKPIPVWEGLWGLFAASYLAIENAPQKRLLRWLARKVFTETHYKNAYISSFVQDQLIVIPERLNLNRLERKCWFRKIKGSKWLFSGY